MKRSRAFSDLQIMSMPELREADEHVTYARARNESNASSTSSRILFIHPLLNDLTQPVSDRSKQPQWNVTLRSSVLNSKRQNDAVLSKMFATIEPLCDDARCSSPHSVLASLFADGLRFSPELHDKRHVD
jgi:hypothetical protein